MSEPTAEELLVLQCLFYSKSIQDGQGGSVSDWARATLNNPGKMDEIFGAEAVTTWVIGPDPEHANPFGGPLIHQETVIKDTERPGEMTRADFEQVLRRAASDPVFASMTIVDVDVTVGSPFNADSKDLLLMGTFEYGGQPIIMFSGTGGEIGWHDNGYGGHYDVTDTVRQQYGLAYFQQMMARYPAGTQAVLSGHSKGGNMAQYVTITDGDRVSQCYSFDGQGFNSAFRSKYGDQIASNGSKITNIAAPLDYVGVLFTPVPGSQQYYAGDRFPRLSRFANGLLHPFLRGHSPFTIFSNIDGRLTLDWSRAGDDPAAVMAGLDDLLGFLQAYMSPEDFRYLCWFVMGKFIDEKPDPYGDPITPPGGEQAFWLRLLPLLKNYCEANDLDPRQLLWLLSSTLPGGIALTPTLMALYQLLPSSRYCTVPRDFTRRVYENLVAAVREVESESWFHQLIDPFEDLWLHIRDWTGNLNFSVDADKRHQYYRQVIDMNNLSLAAIDKIWTDVAACDQAMAAQYTTDQDAVQAITTQVDRLATAIRLA